MIKLVWSRIALVNCSSKRGSHGVSHDELAVALETLRDIRTVLSGLAS